MTDIPDEGWDGCRSQSPEFEQPDDVNDRVDEPGGVEEDD